jgi:ADP-ribosylglycohydrolase
METGYMAIERYAAQMYAGVLGKMIGVYLGRPVEGWSYEKIQEVFGEVDYYVHDRIGAPLVVADDDLSGTFGFFRALEDNGYPVDLTPQQVGQAWLNYIIEDKTILWWGGLGRSTEHTAYLRLKDGVPAPRSGSIALNGPTIAQQIGAQIFMDAFAMTSPGDPDRAVALVRAAASVSHDGIAVEAACFLAAMEALAFDVRPLDDLIEGALPYVTSATLKKLIDDVRMICAQESDWRAVRAWLDPRYGYGVCPGPCHIIPNHAMVLSALLLGGDDFQRSVTIGASAAWDTDCNAGNVGCLNGIRLGLEGLRGGADFRAPVADLLYVVTADGGSCVTDAVQQTNGIVRAAAALNGEPVPARGPRYSFDYPGSTQGFVPCPYGDAPYPVARVGNLNESSDESGLAIEYCALAQGVACQVSTPVFLDFSVLANNFATIASPTLYATQTVRAHVKAFADVNPRLRFYVLYYDSDNEVRRMAGDLFDLVRGVNALEWTVPDTGGMPIFRLGIELVADRRLDGRIGFLDLDWDGAPAAFEQQGMLMTSIWNLAPYWLQAWVSSARQFAPDFTYTYCISHTIDNGVVTMGTQDWADYSVESGIAFSLHEAGGLVLRSKGHRRYYAAILSGGTTASIIARRDNVVETLASVPFPYEMDRVYALRFEVQGDALALSIDGARMLETRDPEGRHARGGAGFVVERGTILADGFRVAAL